MIYLDTSCLVKLIRIEEKSDQVAEFVAGEREVIVSELAELESLIELKAGYMAGDYSLTQWRKLETQLNALRNLEPFIFKPVHGKFWEMAFRQHRNSREIHCRTLDRLHLAAMEHFEITRLITHDGSQAKAAQALKFDVIMPGR